MVMTTVAVTEMAAKRQYDPCFYFAFFHSNYSLQDLYNADGISDLDRELARFRVKLEKKWGNEHDNTFVYIYPDGMKLPLTPHMLKEWARALVSNYNPLIPK